MLRSMAEQQQTRERQMLEAEGPQSDPRIEEVRLAQLELAKIPMWDSKYGSSGYLVASGARSRPPQ